MANELKHFVRGEGGADLEEFAAEHLRDAQEKHRRWLLRLLRDEGDAAVADADEESREPTGEEREIDPDSFDNLPNTVIVTMPVHDQSVEPTSPGFDGSGDSTMPGDPPEREMGVDAEEEGRDLIDEAPELKKCLELDPGYALAYRSLGIVYSVLGDAKAAITAYTRFLELEPNHKDAPKLRQLLEDYRKKSGK